MPDLETCYNRGCGQKFDPNNNGNGMNINLIFFLFANFNYFNIGY